jgi:UDP-N-acetylglucosamine 4,6-dehydratase/5-epimerase
MFKDKVLLITGGTGSFGEAVLSRFFLTPFKEIRIFSRDEKKQDDMRQIYKSPKIKYYIGDVRDYSSIENAMRGSDYVFHAAALKQVPSCEFFPIEAVKTNVIGCDNVLTSAMNNNIWKIIVLSTDKAVYPINAMGQSKALGEKVMMSRARNPKSTIFCATRYGNVMGTRGSVIPLFVNQIKTGKPITITNPSMTRFMMTIEEALDLVLYTFQNGDNGDIFIQKAPAATIETLVHALYELYNVSENISYVGTRHGEKLFETLVTKEEMIVAKDEGKYFRIPMDDRDLNYAKYFTEGYVSGPQKEDYTSHNTQILDINGMKELLLKLPFISNDINNKL